MLETLTFAQSATLTTAIGSALAGLFAVGGAAVLIPSISRFVLPSPKETHLSDFLPFDSIEQDGRTVLMKNGATSRYYHILGTDQSFMDYGQALATARLRKAFLDSLADIGITARIFTVRRPLNITTSTDYPNPTAERVAERWNSQFKTSFRTINLICLTAKKNAEAKLDEAEQSLTSILGPYGVYPLGQNPDKNPERLTLGDVLGSLVSPASSPAPKGTGSNLSDVLAGDVIWFRPDGIIEFTAGHRKRYASALGIKKLGDDMNPQLSNELASLPMEMVISRYVHPMSKGEAMIKLEQHSRLATALTMNASVGEQFAAAMSMVEAMDDSKSALCVYCETIFVFGDSIAEVEGNEATIRAIVASNGSTAVREAGASQASWFLQFPTLDLLPRPYRLFSYNIAFSYTLDRPSSGFSRSDWGDGPIATFRTSSQTIYQHQFHLDDAPASIGHGLVIAPTGSGKTVLMEFLSMMASRHRDLRHFFFDRYQGTAIYNLAMGGKYLSLNADKLPWSTIGGMNPMMCDDTEENRSFLKLWISNITGCADHEDLNEISNAVDIAFDALEKHERSLAAIHQAAFQPNSRVRAELVKWVAENQYGPIFNAEQDCIDLEGNWLTTFDMTKLLDDPTLGAATVSYLMHRIRETMRRNNAPGFIFIDETEPLLRDPSFKRLFQVSLQEFRKIRGAVVSVFQRPEALTASGVSQLVRQQSGTYYLFQNPGARASDYAEFELTERETAFVLGQSGIAKKASRSILIKKPMIQESVIIDVDLSGLGPMLKIFSSSSKDIALVSELYRSLGDNWIKRYVADDAP